MKEYSLRQQGVSRLFPHNGRAELIVCAAVQDGPGLGDIVQHGRGPGCLLAGSFRSDSHILRTARQTHGHIGHGAAVRPDIGKHGVFFPQCLALVPVRHGQREVGSQLKRRIRAGWHKIPHRAVSFGSGAAPCLPARLSVPAARRRPRACPRRQGRRLRRTVSPEADVQR